MVDQLLSSFIPRTHLDFTPKKIKVESNSYTFTTKLQELRKGKFWNKKFNKIYLQPIEKQHLSEVFKTYGVPSIDANRKIIFSPFANIPILDIVFLIIMIYLALRLS